MVGYKDATTMAAQQIQIRAYDLTGKVATMTNSADTYKWGANCVYKSFDTGTYWFGGSSF